MKDKETLRPRGFAFVTFEKEKSVEDVLCQPHHEVDGRRIEAKKAIPKSKSKRLFVGGIHPHVDSDDLREYFSQFGEVRDSQVIRTKSSKSRGFGFIKFDDDNVTEDVLKQVHVLKDKQVCSIFSVRIQALTTYRWRLKSLNPENIQSLYMLRLSIPCTTHIM